ncbi:MAG: hypothetical protein ABSF69_19745 [Polyangiaceae bacterium]
MDKARNDLSAAVPKFCLALEEYRRTPEGRVRTSQEMLAAFFPHDDKTSTDRILKYVPQDVRGPIIAAWGIRGIKAALRDTDEKVQTVVHDALIAGDIDHTAFEDGLAPETLIRWVPLADWWAFWRGGKLTKQAIHKALTTAYELYLFDARWFLDTVQGRGGALKGTDVLSEGLTKEDLTAWVRRIHEAGDGTPKGIVSAIGWDKIVGKTANDVLVAAIDAMVAKVGLVLSGPREPGPRGKLDSHPEVVSAIPAPAGGALRLPDVVERAPVDEGAWSLPPSPPDPAEFDQPSEPTGPVSPPPSEEGINIVLEDELVIGDRAPSSAQAETTPPALPVPEPVPVKATLRDRFPFRPGGKSS